MQKSMQPPLPFSLLLLLHGQLKYLPLQLSQEAQQGLDFGGDHLGQVHVGESGTAGGGGLSVGSDSCIRKCKRSGIGFSSHLVNRHIRNY